MEKDYTLYHLNVSFNGSGITVDVDNDFVEYITKDIVDSLIYDAFCDEVDYVLTKYIGFSNNDMSVANVKDEIREIVYKHRMHYKQFCWRVWVMIDMYGSEVGVGDTVITFVKEGKGVELKHVVVNKVNPNTIEFEYEYVPTVSYYKPSVKTAKRKNNQIILLPPF